MTPVDMIWTYPEESGEAGLFEIGRRLAETLGRGPDVTRFTNDSREMLEATRQIERAARGGHLVVGFQTADKLAMEADRYRELLDAGTQITASATGPRPTLPGLATLENHALAPDSARLQNQWFLVTDRPEPLAFVSYELGDRANFGIGGAGTPGKRFVGFVSDDPGVVDLLMQAALSPIAPPPSPPGPRRPCPAALELAASSDATEAGPASGAGAGSVIVAVGRGADRDAFVTALRIARREGRDLVLVDRSAEGFASPYKDLRGDDTDRPSPDRLFDIAVARREGRQPISLFLEAAAAAGVTAGGWFPTHVGYGGLVEAVRRFGGALLVLPPDAAHPGLAERLRGVVPDQLRTGTSLPVVVAGAFAAVAGG